MLLPIYRSAVRQFDARIRAVRPEQWSLSTPDTDWDVHRLVRHVIRGQATVPELLGKAASVDAGPTDAVPTVSAVSTVSVVSPVAVSPISAAPIADDLSGQELVTQWAAASTAAVEALTAAGDHLEVQLPDGPAPVAELGWRLATELTVHAWDLARAIDAPDEFPNDLLAHVLEELKGSSGRWLPAERYAPSIPVPGCTDDLTELLALTGRNRWWRRDPVVFSPATPA